MQITEVKIFLREGQDKKLKAYATLTFDNCFVVRNVKIIQGNRGLFVAMPSRKIRETCPNCRYKNTIRSKFCNQCGARLPQPQVEPGAAEVRQSEHRDVAHPITLECRTDIQKKVLEAYDRELNRGLQVRTETKPAEEKPFIEENQDDIDEGKDIAL